MAREVAKMNAAVIAEKPRARRLSCRLHARRAERIGPFTRPFGTARIASSESDETSGRIIRPITRRG